MTDPACNGESLQDLVAQLSDVLHFIFDQQHGDIVVLVGDDGVNRALLSQLQAVAPSALARGAMERPDILSGRTRIRRISERLHVVVQ
jgi:broad specificity phosphatase PhoE